MGPRGDVLTVVRLAIQVILIFANALVLQFLAALMELVDEFTLLAFYDAERSRAKSVLSLSDRL